MWKKAIIFYSVAAPLVLSVAVMFIFFSESMTSGQVCKFNELAGHSQADCLVNYATNSSKYIELAGFRYQALLCGVFLPVVFYLLEFFLNQILISWKHIVYQYLFTLCYAGITAAWQSITGTAVIYPKTLDWICATREGGTEDCLFSECILWFIYFMVVQSGCYSLVLLMHYLKSKYCCVRSVTIVTHNRDVIENLGSIVSSKHD